MLPYPYKCVHFCLWTHTYSCVLSFIYPLSLFFPFPSLHLVPRLHSYSSGSRQGTVLLFIGHLSHLAGEVAHFSLLHNLSDFPPVIKHRPDMTRPDSIAYYHLFKASKPEKGRWACPDGEAAERGVLPSGPHWDQHNMSAWSRYITSHQRLEDTRCLSYRTGQATEYSPCS